MKPAYGQPIDQITYDKTMDFFDRLLRIMHPFLPFITEELWQQSGNRKEGESIMACEWPKAGAPDSALIKDFERVKEITATVRALRQEKGVSPKEALILYAKTTISYPEIICKMANLSAIETVDSQPECTTPFRLDTSEYFLRLAVNINIEEELAKLNEDLAYQQKFLNSVNAKLSNEKFVGSAPAQVVALERKKQSDAEARIKAIQEQITNLQIDEVNYKAQITN